MKQFKVFVKALNEESVTVKGKKIKVEKPLRARKDKLVWVDAKKFDAAFKKDTDFYIGPGGAGGIKGRYPRFELFLFGGKEQLTKDISIPYTGSDSMEVSEVSVNDEGKVGFINGRHRYAWLRDQGLKKIPVAMSKDSIKNAEKFNYLMK